MTSNRRRKCLETKNKERLLKRKIKPKDRRKRLKGQDINEMQLAKGIRMTRNQFLSIRGRPRKALFCN